MLIWAMKTLARTENKKNNKKRAHSTQPQHPSMFERLVIPSKDNRFKSNVGDPMSMGKHIYTHKKVDDVKRWQDCFIDLTLCYYGKRYGCCAHVMIFDSNLWWFRGWIACALWSVIELCLHEVFNVIVWFSHANVKYW